MYIINQKPGEAAKKNGFARFPEDFERLRPGQTVVVWKDGNNWKIETVNFDVAAIKSALRLSGCVEVAV